MARRRGLALSLRLVFEQNLQHGYYMMALSVSLSCSTSSRVAYATNVVAWLILVILVFDNGSTDLFYNVSLAGEWTKDPSPLSSSR